MKIVEIEIKAETKEKFSGMYVMKIPAGTTFVKALERNRQIVVIGLYDETGPADLLIDKTRTFGITRHDRLVPNYMRYIDSVLIQGTHIWHIFERK
jgi:hypothetical protein